MPHFYTFLVTSLTLVPLPQLIAAAGHTWEGLPLGSTHSMGLPTSAGRPANSGGIPSVTAHHLLVGEQMRVPSMKQANRCTKRWKMASPLGGTGQGNFVAPATNPNPAVGINPQSVVVGDVDGDGDLDLLTANDLLNGTVSVRLNDGRGNFSVPTTNPEPAVGNHPTDIAVGDIDKDGDLDLLTANAGTSTVSVRLNDGRGSFAAPATNPEPAVGNFPVSVTVGDVDGDGDLDLVTANRGGFTVSICLNDGRGSFSAPATNANPAVGNTPLSVEMGDVDGDGDLDLLTANYGDNTVSVRLNDGRGSFSAPAINPNPTVGDSPTSVTVGDVDSDGDLDLLTANYNYSGTVSVRLNNGRGSFSAPVINPEPTVGSFPTSVTVGDVDGDGDLDLLAANAFSETVSVRLNQSATPLPVRPGSLTNVLALFPNPTNGSLMLRGAVAGAPIEVLDALGRLVLRTAADAAGIARLVFPPNLTSGIYVVRTGQQAQRVILN
jgi:hypothetical protein